LGNRFLAFCWLNSKIFDICRKKVMAFLRRFFDFKPVSNASYLLIVTHYLLPLPYGQTLNCF
ncbi:MAG: hypothetical protein DRR19_23010, partial [Candidatus Parabeggiatoa sp. nov. 1]